MLKWSVVFLVIAIIAALFGFGDLEDRVTVVSQYVFFLFAALFFVSLFAVETRKR